MELVNQSSVEKSMKDIYNFLKRKYFLIRSFVISPRIYGIIKYYMLYHKYLDLKNPKTFDEKLWWLKLNYFNPLMTKCTDKYGVRDYVKSCGLEDILNDCYGKFDSVEEIDVKKMPDEFFLKCNHLSGGNIICHKNDFDKKKLKKIFSHYLKSNFYYTGFERNYKDIKPAIIAERVLRMKDNSTLLDYKFMCFEGVPKLLFLDIGVANADGTHAEEYYRNIYDMSFKPVDIKETREHYDYTKIAKPENFDYMVECARILSKPFPHCRVDLYNVDGKVYFGEITFFHGSGYNDIQPYSADLMMGSWIPLMKE